MRCRCPSPGALSGQEEFLEGRVRSPCPWKCSETLEAVLGYFFHLNPARIADADFQHRSIRIKGQVCFHRRRLGELALMIEFLDGKDIQGDGVTAEPQLVQNAGVMQHPEMLALILSD